MGLSFTLDDKQKAFLLREARQSIETFLDGQPDARPLWPDPECSERHAGLPLSRNLGSFVTLKQKGALRGCIGTIIGQEPLYLNVWRMARQAAFNDPRFPPLAKEEWPDTDLEISVLDQPSICPDPQQIEIGRDGLILTYNGRSGVFLPQVPLEQHWNREQYLEHLCIKAGLPPGSWSRPGAALYWYEALAFSA